MNAARRKAIAATVIEAQLLSAQLSELMGKFADLKANIETIRDEEQEAFDAMPESLQGSERGETSQSAIDSLDEAANHAGDIETELDNASDLIDNDIVSALEGASE